MKIHFLAYLFIYTFFSGSCKKFIEVPKPIDSLEESLIFSTDQSALSAVSGVYYQMLNISLNLSNGGVTIYAGLAADEISHTTPTVDYDQFFTNAIESNNSTGIYNRLWGSAYQNIYRANAVLEGLNKSSSLSDSLKTQLIGEMKVVRAFYYFYLVNLFGDVPLAITTDYAINAIMPRISSAEIYQQIVSDLRDAEIALRVNYPSAGRVRPNRRTATALLARVYLYLKDWPNAEAAATTVIESGLYKLDTLPNVFLSTSTEAIWQLMPLTATSNTAEGNTFVPSGTAKPAFAITNSLLNSFKTGDNRKILWIKTTNAVPHPFKYQKRNGVATSENYIVLRLGEQYLIRAEARAQQNNVLKGLEDLMLIRNRAKAGNITAPDKDSLVKAVQNERQLELFAEWGHRWLDLKRTGKINDVLKAIPIKAPYWQETDALFPIPFVEIQRNPRLKQNPGYE